MWSRGGKDRKGGQRERRMGKRRKTGGGGRVSRLWNARNEDESELTRSEHTHTSSLPQGAILYSTVFPLTCPLLRFLPPFAGIIPSLFPFLRGFSHRSSLVLFSSQLFDFLSLPNFSTLSQGSHAFSLLVLAHSPLPPISLVHYNYRVSILFRLYSFLSP